MTVSDATYQSWGVKASGAAQLSGGLVTVPCPAVKANSVILLTPIAGSVNLGTLVVVSYTVGVSFQAGSTNVLDNSGFYWAVL